MEKFNIFVAGVLLPCLLMSVVHKEVGWVVFDTVFFILNLRSGLKKDEK